MKDLLVITGFESSGSVFTARIASFALGKCKKFGDWHGYGWNGRIGDDLVIIHRSMPYGRNPKRWHEDLKKEIEGINSYRKSFVICTRDLSISKLSRIRRFGGSFQSYSDDDIVARSIFAKLMSSERTFIFSFESAVCLGDSYYQKFYEWLGVNSDFSPPLFDANEPYILNGKQNSASRK